LFVIIQLIHKQCRRHTVQLKCRGTITKRGVTKIDQDFANQNWLIMGIKIRKFYSSSCGQHRGGLRSLGQSPQNLAIFTIFFKKNNSFWSLFWFKFL